MEEALHDTPLYCEFAGLDVGMTWLPDESTILRLRHLLEEHNLSIQLLATINATLIAKGLMLKTGTVVDATLIAGPSSIKNSMGERDPEMQTLAWCTLSSALRPMSSMSRKVMDCCTVKKLWCLRMPVTKARSSGLKPPVLTGMSPFAPANARR